MEKISAAEIAQALSISFGFFHSRPVWKHPSSLFLNVFMEMVEIPYTSVQFAADHLRVSYTPWEWKTSKEPQQGLEI